MTKRGVFTLCMIGGLALCAEAQQKVQTLDEVIVQTAKAIEAKLPQGSKVAVLNFSSASEIFSGYVIEEFSGVLVMDGRVIVIERLRLDLVRKELQLQLSGDVSDDSAQAIGKQLGAQMIISGSLTNMGNAYRFRVKAINVETARIEAQISFNLYNDDQVAFLLYGNQQSAPPAAAAPAPAPAPAPKPASPAPAAASTAPAANAPAPASAAPATAASGDQSRPGLYAGGAYQGAMDLLDAVDWLALNAKNDGVYTIVLGKDQGASNITFSYKNMKVAITLKASGGERKVNFDTNRPAYALFTVGAGVTFTLEDGVTMIGLKENSRSFVQIEGGTFIMNGGTLKDNKCSNSDDSGNGGGVYIKGGTFTMNGGAISGNSVNRVGGGVYMNGGTFTMNGGAISGNSARNYGGGGVYVVNKGTFTMNGGTISGNSADEGVQRICRW